MTSIVFNIVDLMKINCKP